ncbi:response regulator transcription factor [Thermogemmatispora carboxidivorans]|uniref:response regulator transcription factor n=1 Tax=Thermogemmatispora carboxidivorans TaxID=1382306 RepID=UPI00069AD5BF|nr:response regulator transcription factor [Thermogemmatispora carboxidivorans]
MQQGNIVIATSDAFLGSLLQRALQAQGYETVLCNSAAAALAQLAARRSKLLIVDLALSDDTAWGLLRQARARALLAPDATRRGACCLPVILLSANPLQTHASPELRPFACLPRICPLGALLRLVARAYDQGEQERGEEGQAGQVAPAHEVSFPGEEKLYA